MANICITEEQSIEYSTNRDAYWHKRRHQWLSVQTRFIPNSRQMSARKIKPVINSHMFRTHVYKFFFSYAIKCIPEIQLLNIVQNKNQLVNWREMCDLVCMHNSNTTGSTKCPKGKKNTDRPCVLTHGIIYKKIDFGDFFNSQINQMFVWK